MPENLTPPPPPLPSSHFPLLPVLIFSTLSLFLGLTLGKYLFSPAPSAPPIPSLPSPTSIPTTSPAWQTYSYPEYNYSFRAPQGYLSNPWTPGQNDPTILQIVNFNEQPASQGPNDFIVSVHTQIPHFEISPTSTSHIVLSSNNTDWTQVNINSYCDETNACKDIRFYTSSGKYYYQVSGRSKSLLTHILSTFKFTTSQSVVDLLQPLVTWQVSSNVPSQQVLYDPYFRCADGTKHNPALPVTSMSYGRGHPDMSPSVFTVMDQAKTILEQNGWVKCTAPTTTSNPDNTVPNDAYIKDGKLLVILESGSMGVGYSLNIQFEN